MAICLQSEPTVRPEFVTRKGALQAMALVGLLGAFVFTARLNNRSEALTALPSVPGGTSGVDVSGVHCQVQEGYVTITGDLRNLSTSSLSKPQVVAEFRNGDGELLGIERALAMESIVRPGSGTAFEVISRLPAGTVGYRVRVNSGR
ncbi:MAG: FxLYD domain-containing protein [Chthonomonadales bacterium]